MTVLLRGSRRWLAMMSLLAAFSVHASIRVTVDTTTDEFSAGAAHCSLREALYAVATAAPFAGCTLGTGAILPSVSLPAGTFSISLPKVPANAYAGGAFYIGASLIVQGAGAGVTIIDGNAVDGVFLVEPGTNGLGGFLGVTIRNGRSMQGAGITHGAGLLLVQQSVVSDNAGYGIFSTNTIGATLEQATVSNNQGTGVYFFNSSATTSTTYKIENTTISGNVSQNDVGGLSITSVSGAPVSVTVNNATIAYNTGRADGLHFDVSGGVAIQGADATLYLRNSILARNVRGDRTLEDCASTGATIVSQGYNVIEQASSCSGSATDILGIDPKLAPLWDYGGGIPTHAVFPGSVAVNAGNPTTPGPNSPACATMDARGMDRTTNTPCDIGAYEYHADFLVDDTNDISDAMPGDGLCKTSQNTCTLRAAIDEANASATFRTIELSAGTFAITKPPGGALYSNVDGDFLIGGSYPVTIIGAGADKTIVSGGNLDTVMTLYGNGIIPLALHGMTFENGYATQHFGGGLEIEYGNALLDRVRITDSEGVKGGGVYVGTGNSASVIDSTIDNNGWNGTIENGGGGGIYVAPAAQLQLLNSTIADNKSAGPGGGIDNFGAVSMAFTTIVGNNQQYDMAYGGGIGGASGIYRATNSIITGNIASSGATDTPADCDSSLIVLGYIFVGTSGGHCSIGGAITFGLSGFDPLLAPLQLDGGDTPTIAPAAQSPLINFLTPKADCSDLSGHQILSDQRGVARPDFDGWQMPDVCDIGAFQGVSSDIIFVNAFDLNVLN